MANGAMSAGPGAGGAATGNSITAEPVGEQQAQEMKDPTRGPQAKTIKQIPSKTQAAANAKATQKKAKNEKKKKKGLLHKLVPF
jgi:hypothetical protein